MKTIILFLLVLAFSILWPTVLSLGACPEAPNDNGICDTLSVEAYSPDLHFIDAGQLVRVTLSITHDLTGPVDSLAAMVIPLCYTHTNPTKYCSLSEYWNKLSVSGTTLSRSIFRDIDGINNRFLDMYQPYPSFLFNDFNLNVSTSAQHFWFSWIPQPEIGRWGTSNHELTLTLTFRVEDTMTVCIDSCFWSSSNQLKFYRSDAATYIPRHNLPYCFSVYCPVRGNPTGGINGDCLIDVGDIIFLIGYLYKSAPAPDPLERGDADCNGIVDIGDVIYLINYLFKGGPAPSC